MLAYKGFHKNLNCTMGKGDFHFVPGKWYSEENAKCANTGFHATDNPLDVLSYYSGQDDRYFIVNLRGNVDEDGVNSRIAAPEIMLVKELTKDELYRQGVIWISKHQKAPWAAVVEEETGDAQGEGNVVVRGKKPKAKGKTGDNLYIIREDKAGNIVEIGAFKVDGVNILPGIYYNAEGGAVIDKKRTGKAKNTKCNAGNG